MDSMCAIHFNLNSLMLPGPTVSHVLYSLIFLPEERNKAQLCMPIHLNLAAAFNSVDHEVLLTRLQIQTELVDQILSEGMDLHNYVYILSPLQSRKILEFILLFFLLSICDAFGEIQKSVSPVVLSICWWYFVICGGPLSLLPVPSWWKRGIADRI